MSHPAIENLVIIGSGPAGYTAAIYAGRANLKPLMFEGFQAGGVPGGQLMTTTEVENFPGFPEGVDGPTLVERMKQQAEHFGAEYRFSELTAADLSKRPFRLHVDAEEWIGSVVPSTARVVGWDHRQATIRFHDRIEPHLAFHF